MFNARPTPACGHSSEEGTFDAVKIRHFGVTIGLIKGIKTLLCIFSYGGTSDQAYDEGREGSQR